MPIHLLSGMKGKFEVRTDVNGTDISSIPGPSPKMQQASINNITGGNTSQLGEV